MPASLSHVLRHETDSVMRSHRHPRPWPGHCKPSHPTPPHPTLPLVCKRIPLRSYCYLMTDRQIQRWSAYFKHAVNACCRYRAAAVTGHLGGVIWGESAVSLKTPPNPHITCLLSHASEMVFRVIFCIEAKLAQKNVRIRLLLLSRKWWWWWWSESSSSILIQSFSPSFLQVQTTPCIPSRYQVFSKMEQ